MSENNKFVNIPMKIWTCKNLYQFLILNIKFFYRHIFNRRKPLQTEDTSKTLQLPGKSSRKSRELGRFSITYFTKKHLMKNARFLRVGIKILRVIKFFESDFDWHHPSLVTCHSKYWSWHNNKKARVSLSYQLTSHA